MIALTTRSSDWLEINEKTMHVCCKSDDCLDALLCALIARAVEVGQVLPISDQGREHRTRAGSRFRAKSCFPI